MLVNKEEIVFITQIFFQAKDLRRCLHIYLRFNLLSREYFDKKKITIFN